MVNPFLKIKSLLRFSPLVETTLSLSEESLQVEREPRWIWFKGRRDIFSLDQILSFQVEHRETRARVILEIREPPLRLTLGWFNRSELEDFSLEVHNRMIPTVHGENLPSILPFAELGERMKQLIAGDDLGLCRLVDLILCQGVLHRCSDIHFDPRVDDTVVRYRMDGMFHDVGVFPKRLERQLISRIKVLAKLVTYETRVPQEGRISLQLEGREVDMRVSVYPTLQGEKVALRIFDSQGANFDLASIGHNQHVVTQLRKLLARPSGTILLTGPSGSGKTTTIYACLREIKNLQDRLTNIVTIEDPIEHRLEGIQQTEIFEPKGLTFLTGLRAMLRQNADVIMVGEIRDEDTASTAIQAGLTGHLVISTLHAGTSARVLARLVEMGIEPFLIASSITAILAQRLPRRNCPWCTEAYTPGPETLLEVQQILPQKVSFMRGKGCDYCKGIGYLGRVPASELLVVDETIEQVIQDRATVRELEQVARRNGMKTLWEDGLDKVIEGTLSPDELVRIIPKPVSDSFSG